MHKGHSCMFSNKLGNLGTSGSEVQRGKYLRQAKYLNEDVGKHHICPLIFAGLVWVFPGASVTVQLFPRCGIASCTFSPHYLDYLLSSLSLAPAKLTVKPSWICSCPHSQLVLLHPLAWSLPHNLNTSDLDLKFSEPVSSLTCENATEQIGALCPLRYPARV